VATSIGGDYVSSWAQNGLAVATRRCPPEGVKPTCRIYAYTPHANRFDLKRCALSVRLALRIDNAFELAKHAHAGQHLSET
jgi:hypothetical protein